MHQYPTDQAKEEAVQYPHSFNQWRIDTLTGVLDSQIQNPTVIDEIEKEINRLKAVNVGLLKK